MYIYPLLFAIICRYHYLQLYILIYPLFTMNKSAILFHSSPKKT